MKPFILFNIVVIGSVAVTAVLFFLVYFLFLKKRETKVRPSVFVAILLMTALAVSTVGNIMYSSRYSDYMRTVDMNKVDFCGMEGFTERSQPSLYEFLYTAEDLPGYYRHTFDIEDYTVTYYLRNYPEEAVTPGFDLFVEYTGEEADTIKWLGGHVMWLDHGVMEDETYCFLEEYSKKIMLIGSIARNIDEIFFDISYFGPTPEPQLEFTIPIDVERT